MLVAYVDGHRLRRSMPLIDAADIFNVFNGSWKLKKLV